MRLKNLEISHLTDDRARVHNGKFKKQFNPRDFTRACSLILRWEMIGNCYLKEIWL